MFSNNGYVDGYISEDEQAAEAWWSTQWADLDLGDAPEPTMQREVPSVLTKV